MCLRFLSNRITPLKGRDDERVRRIEKRKPKIDDSFVVRAFRAFATARCFETDFQCFNTCNHITSFLNPKRTFNTRIKQTPFRFDRERERERRECVSSSSSRCFRTTRAAKKQRTGRFTSGLFGTSHDLIVFVTTKSTYYSTLKEHLKRRIQKQKKYI